MLEIPDIKPSLNRLQQIGFYLLASDIAGAPNCLPNVKWIILIGCSLVAYCLIMS
jgi:hypothetical protein